MPASREYRVDPTLALNVRRRANGACEYCRMPQSAHRVRFSVDHIIARQHKGPTGLENLALCCLHCNSHKGPNLSGIDPETGQLSPLFNPRQQLWQDHFGWRGAEIVGRTSVGRSTIAVLAMNDPDYLAIRASLLAEGIFPPTP